MKNSPEVQAIIDRTNAEHEAQSGHERLWGWFSLSRAGFLTMPRVLMHAMPDEWQKQMAILCEQYDAAFPNQPNLSTRVSCISGETGRITKFPEWILDYRHPNQAEIDALRTRPESAAVNSGENAA